MQKRFGSTVLAATLLFGGAVLVVPRAASALNAHESGFLSRLNGERTSRGIDALTLKPDLTAVARAHSQRMADDGEIYHNTGLAEDVDGDWNALAENVGKGPTVESIHIAFMESTSHRVHILDPDFNQVGVGTAVADGVIYVTEIFADRASPAAPAAPPPSKVTRVQRRPEPPRPPPPPRSVSVSVLLVLVGMDAEAVDPRTGAALSGSGS